MSYDPRPYSRSPLDAWVERVAHPLDVDGVEVPAQQQRAPAAGSASADEDARPAGRALQPLDRQPAIGRPRRDEVGDRALRRAPPTSAGFTESIATSRASRSMASLMIPAGGAA
jgi:hypothetical protein